MKALPILIILSFAWCPPDANLASDTPYAENIERVRVAWSQDSALPAERCAEPYIRFEDWPACSDGGECLLGTSVHDYGRYTLYIRKDPDDATTRARILHEAVHWLAQCSGYQAFGDPGHADILLWDTGVLGRASQ